MVWSKSSLPVSTLCGECSVPDWINLQLDPSEQELSPSIMNFPRNERQECRANNIWATGVIGIVEVPSMENDDGSASPLVSSIASHYLVSRRRILRK